MVFQAVQLIQRSVAIAIAEAKICIVLQNEVRHCLKSIFYCD